MVKDVYLDTEDDSWDPFLVGCVFIPGKMEMIEPEWFSDINESENAEDVVLDLENKPPHSQTPQETGLPEHWPQGEWRATEETENQTSVPRSICPVFNTHNELQ